MEYEQLVTLQGFAKFGLLTLTFIVFYSYAYSIYKRDKKGERNFESYSNLVLDDNIASVPLENNREEQIKDDQNHVCEQINKTNKIKKGDS